MMKKILIPVLLLLAVVAKAQFNNSWIDYNRTYYKFKLSKDTLCRIPQAVLSGAGLAAANADNFQLWRNGQQVRLYTSVSGVPLGSADYLEFWGQMNDGKPDKPLYRDQDYQLADKYSLETDTAAYFLTVSPTGGNLRYTNAANPSPGAAAPDAYFMRNVDVYFNTRINRGLARSYPEYVYSSAYDKGEGWSSGDVAPGFDLFQGLTGLNVYTAGPANSLSLRINAAGNSPYERNLRVRLFNNEIYNVGMPYFEYSKGEVNNLPLSYLQNNSTAFLYVGSVASNINARLVVSSIGITYPAVFNFNNEKNFSFELAAAPAGNNLVIDNFNYGSTAPLLYDINTGNRYSGDIISTPGKVKFVLPASADVKRKFILMSQESVYTVNSVAQRVFTNYTSAAQQGDYLIISNSRLYNDGNGNNYVDQYRQYRSSEPGGGFNTKIYNIDELADQFAFGIRKHPEAVRNFLQYANQQFPVKPKYVFIIGRGMDYIDENFYQTNPLSEALDLVPSFGWPASDILLASAPGTVDPIIPIGRLGAVSGTEVSYYLQKIKDYEQKQQTNSPFISDKAWMKNVMHVSGGKDASENDDFKAYMSGYENIIKDTLFGAHVETFSKTSAGAVEQANIERIGQLFQEGLSLIGYFGHSSANTFEFNLSDPALYNNSGKYPFFNVSGCSAGNFFTFDPLRFAGNSSISEKYVLANQRGSIGFLADTHFGIPFFLDRYNRNFYTEFGRTLYGNTVGNQIQKVIRDLDGDNFNLNYETRLHLEEILLHGDPAVRINSFTKPDYVIEDQEIKINPSIISVADNNFTVNVRMLNIGKAVNDSMWISIKRKLPNDTIRVLYNQLVPGIKYADSVNLTVPINPATDKGLNQIIVSLDYTNRVDETFETNNNFTKDFYIFEDELRPSYPYNYSIISTQNINYIANTANPLSGQRQYTMEIDTTELFNSAFKKTYNANGLGGIIQFSPTNITFTDSTVYYWRTGLVPVGTEPIIWNNSSFVYLPNSLPGFNQSHYFQHAKSTYQDLTLDADRVLRFKSTPRLLTIRTGLYPFFDFDKINVNVDFTELEQYGCKYNSLQFYVFDSSTLKPWYNKRVGSFGRFGSWPPDCNGATAPDRIFFEFPYGDPVYRKNAMDFIDSIPAGMCVAITNLGYTVTNASFINQWKADTAVLGAGKSLYHKLKSIGFNKIDSFSRNLPFLYFFKKGIASYTPIQDIGPEDSSYINEAIPIISRNIEGTIESPVFGPAKKWNALHWRGTALDDPKNDTTSIELYGVTNAGVATLLKTIAPARDTSISFVNAATYPYIKLKMNNKNDVSSTPYQLGYWRVNADYVPEGAVAPNILFTMKDTVSQGENIDFSLAFKNISQTAFDSAIKVKFTITDKNYVAHVIDIPKRKALVAGDTLIVSYTIDSRNYPGINTLFIDFNPDNDQPEQYHYNNVLYKNFYVREDRFNPLLDVTFDGVHILNQDLVSSKPNILIKLKDENRYLALKDTSLIKVQVRNPDQSLHNYYFGDTMRFNPANLTAGENTASIDFKPYFPEDGVYELLVTGKDANGNKAGELDYQTTFSVINKPMISNLLNYPNPFTTSTAFVFTVTGTQIPQNMRIQILTITGKVVREITQDELGPIHVGRNITEFKWNGTDMYGQKLANGVYIYRVLTNLNGKSLDKYKADGDNTDKFFNKGYGKMYLMR
ncbi:MAG: C25 family cysteine peptidase [Ferruginibacter sp.]